MIARGLTTAVLLALAITGARGCCRLVTSIDNAPLDASATVAPAHNSAATLTVGDASDVSVAGASKSGADSKSTTADAALPNAPQAKATSSQAKPVAGYTRPTHKVKLVNYLFDAFGPYPIVASGLLAGINQARNSPRDWDQGMTGFGRRWGSNYGISAITTSTRYGLADLLREDTLYYRCECSGFFPRLKHAAIFHSRPGVARMVTANFPCPRWSRPMSEKWSLCMRGIPSAMIRWMPSARPTTVCWCTRART